MVVDVKAARTENCKDGSVLMHLYPSKVHIARFLQTT